MGKAFWGSVRTFDVDIDIGTKVIDINRSIDVGEQVTKILSFLLSVNTGREVCYNDLGCFTSSFPWSGLPESPEEINTRFLVFTKDTMENYKVISARNLSSITASSFRPHKVTRFIIQGYINDEYRNWIRDMCLKLFTIEDVNCIAVTWSKGSEDFHPTKQGSINIRVVSAEVALVIQTLTDRFNCSRSNIHLIGHGLGAHAAGQTGRRIPGLGRITVIPVTTVLL
ncbi:inactive pancreatic lipase-related protein 1-like [Microcaecilia unicolor]|uniref:Triacylglycerol lipase n=1 Tax=Microcaecilia unicolor TaxID=1415580 RepID=A0A6P7YBZ3_9AMPH|nr:inactive pancreatic lipase-related protein 1-like [Microcaecilia unicolor]